MTKGIIVLNDIPVICAECNFAAITPNKEYLRCEAKNRIIYNAKPDWCPIRVLPEMAHHEDYCDNGRYDKGWNDCLNEVLGIDK